MAKLCSVYATTLLLLTISGTLMAMVAGDNCQENIGDCNGGSEACNSRCSFLHQGGQGLCKPPVVRGGQKYCWCSYACHPKICEVGIGPIGGCDDRICDAACRVKYAGQGPTGYCYSLGPPIYSNCHCRYFC